MKWLHLLLLLVVCLNLFLTVNSKDSDYDEENEDDQDDVEQQEEDDADYDDDDEEDDETQEEDERKDENKEHDNEHYQNERHPYEGDEHEAEPEEPSPEVQQSPIATGVTPAVCTVNGKQYKDGETIPRPSPCEHCVCRSGHSLCHHTHCFPRFCSKTYIPTGECCPICECKDHHGNQYEVGTKFSTEHKLFGMGEMCMECDCKLNKKGHKTAQCSYQMCPTMKNCVETYVPKGRCCPVCKAFSQLLKPCRFEGQTKSHGVHWKLDTCFACTCSNGEVICNKNCPELKCRTKYRPGECCPVCEDGSVNPRTFPPFPPFPKQTQDTKKPRTFPPFPPFPGQSKTVAQPKTFPPFPALVPKTFPPISDSKSKKSNDDNEPKHAPDSK